MNRQILAVARMNLIVLLSFGSCGVGIALSPEEMVDFPGRTLLVGEYPEQVIPVDVNNDDVLDLVVFDEWVTVHLGNGHGAFTLESTFLGGKPVFTSTVGDVDMDGNVDVVTPRFDEAGAVVRFGDGTGHFGDPVYNVVGLYPVAVELADLDGDGDLDLIGLTEEHVVSVENDGEGVFSNPSYVATGAVARAMIVGDFNGDNDPDVATISRYDSNVRVLLGKGGLLFHQPISYAVASEPWDIDALDMDEDGDLELVTANLYGSGLSILESNGDGTFQPHSVFSTAIEPITIGHADLNGDGDQDLVVGSQELYGFDVYFGTTGMGFQPPVFYPQGESILDVALADLNQDDAPDLIYLLPLPNNVVIDINDGEGGFFHQTLNAVPGFPSFLTGGDFNNDGFIDLLTGDADDANLHMLKGQCGGTFSDPILHEVEEEAQDIESVDFDGDGWLDVVTANPDNLTLHRNTGDGFEVAQTVPITTAYTQGIYITIADFNGDNQVDFVVTHRDFYRLSIVLSAPDGSYAPVLFRDVLGAPWSSDVADFNGDGFMDLVTLNREDDSISLLLGNGDGTFQTEEMLEYPNLAELIVAGDFNNDGRVDLAVTDRKLDPEDPAIFPTNVSILVANENGGFTAQPDMHPVGLACVTRLHVLDINQDGTLDILVACAYSNSVTVIAGKGDATFSESQYFSLSRDAYDLFIADFNRDGRPDIAAASWNDERQLSVLLQGGASQDASEGETERRHSADWNGDNAISLSEILRLVQFFNVGSINCAAPSADSEDGFVPTGNDTCCKPHSSDYAPQDWEINLSELLRAVQFFSSGGYRDCQDELPPTEDGFCPGIG